MGKNNHFSWKNWIKPLSSNNNVNYHVIGWNLDDKVGGFFFDGVHYYDLIDNKKINCQLSNKKAKKCKNCSWYRK